MESEQASRPITSTGDAAEPPLSEPDDPYSPGTVSSGVLGFLLAILALAVPLMAVLTDREVASIMQSPNLRPSDGPQTASTISITRARESGRRDSRRQPQ